MSNGAKVSKVVSITPYGAAYPAPGSQVADRHAYKVVFEDGTDGYMEGILNSAPVLVGKQYAYVTSKTKSGNTKVELMASPAAAAPPAEKVSPQLQPPTRSFAEAAAATPKATPEQLAAEAGSGQTQKNLLQGGGAKVPGEVFIPDNKPRTGVVELIRHTIETFDKGATTKVKWYITMKDGAKGIMWSDSPEDQPVTIGQELNYIYDKVYSDGKKITLVPLGVDVDKETIVMRMACVNSAIALLAIPGNIQNANYEPTLENTLSIAKELEAHVTRSND